MKTTASSVDESVFNGQSKIRQWLWLYPERLLTISHNTKPLLSILLSTLLAILILNFLTSTKFKEHLQQKAYVNRPFTEGMLGNITVLNPIYVTDNPIDRSIFTLVFTKLVYIDSEENIKPGIADRWEVSNNGTRYIFHVQEGLYWHDDTPITADDVVFTYQTAINLAKNNSQDTIGQAFEDVKVKKLNDFTVEFTLQKPNAAFLEIVSKYIIPKHIFDGRNMVRLNKTFPQNRIVGSGAYRVSLITPQKIILKSVTNRHINTVKFVLYNDVQSLTQDFYAGKIDAIGAINFDLDDSLKKNKRLTLQRNTLYNRTKLLYLNLRRKKFSNQLLRNAIALMINRTQLLDNSGISGEPAYTVYAPLSWAYNKSLLFPKYNSSKAEKLLLDAGYQKDSKTGLFQDKDKKVLSFTLTYLDSTTNNNLARALQEQLQMQGIVVTLNPESFEELTKETIATRDFDILLYELETTIDPDQYSLWHSTKVDYPLLNLSGYNSVRVDVALEKGRTTLNKQQRANFYKTFQQNLIVDTPIIPLYHPTFTYYVNKHLQNVNLQDIVYPYQRFEDIAQWSWK